MRSLLILGIILAGSAAFAQAPAPVRPAAPAAPAVRRAPAAPAARSGMAVTVTDPRGIVIPDVHVEVLGVSDRRGDTSANGQLNFTAMQAGTYRLRFTGDAVIAFEKEVTLRAGQIADLDIILNPAPKAPEPAAPPPPPPPPPPPAPPAVGPSGKPLTLSVPDLLEKDFVGSQPRRETLLSCSGNSRTTMIQLNMPMPERLYDAADITYYVVAGEGSVRMGGQETRLATNAFVSVPRATPHSFARTGRRPLILMATLSGEPCEQPR